jgi:hypothetical protein
MRHASLVALSAFLLALGIDCSGPPLRLPEQLRALPDTADTREAILIAMQRRQWSMMDEQPQAILAGIDVRGHVAKMWVEYDAEYVRFRYGGSHALECRPEGDGCSSIHKKYIQWTRNLAKAISEELSARRSPPAVTGEKLPPQR